MIVDNQVIFHRCGRNKVVDKQGVLWYDCTIKI